MTESKKLELSINPKTYPAVLVRLANDNSQWIRKRVALNPGTPIETLEKLSKDKNVHVRWYVASNTNISLNFLKL